MIVRVHTITPVNEGDVLLTLTVPKEFIDDERVLVGGTVMLEGFRPKPRRKPRRRAKRRKWSD